MSETPSTSLILSCEHATHFVPPRYRHLFHGHADVLRSHRGWDPGTLTLGRAFQRTWSAPLFATTVSRLLVETNRSVGHRQLFSEFSRALSPEEKQSVLGEYYFPHRETIEAEIAKRIARGERVVHLSLHSFTPVLDGLVRKADAGLLYDPRRMDERGLCRIWRQAMVEQFPSWRVRLNYPYLGKTDGLTTFLRKKFADEAYCGVELEVNQRLVLARSTRFENDLQRVVDSLTTAIHRWQDSGRQRGDNRLFPKRERDISLGANVPVRQRKLTNVKKLVGLGNDHGPGGRDLGDPTDQLE